MLMRIIKSSTVREWMREHPNTRPGLLWWLDVVKTAGWRNLAELKQTFPKADQVKVASGRLVIVFNLSGNAYRLVAAIHFNTGLVYALAISVFGGSAQFNVAALTKAFHSDLVPAVYMGVGVLVGLVAMLMMRESAPVKTGELGVISPAAP